MYPCCGMFMMAYIVVNKGIEVPYPGRILTEITIIR